MRCLHYTLITVTLLGGPVAPVSEGQIPPPRYRATVLASFDGNDTTAYAVNDLGQTTGQSGFMQTGIQPAHAYFGTAAGSLQSVMTLTCQNSRGDAINNSGVIAGTIDLTSSTSGERRLFRYRPGVGVEDLGQLGGDHGEVTDMNEAGEIVGGWENGEFGQYEAFLYRDGDGWIPLGTMGDLGSIAVDINEHGQVAGYAWPTYSSTQAFVWQDGVMTPLGTLGGAESTPYYIANDGTVVGSSTRSDLTRRAFRYTAARGMEEVPALPGATESDATWITDSGLIAGVALVGAEYRAYMYSDATGVVDVGLDTGMPGWRAPVAMNQSGVAVYVALEPHAYEFRPMVFSQGFGLHNLNDLLANDLPYPLDEPTDISEAGHITAVTWARFDGPDHHQAVLLTPIAQGDMNCDSAVDFGDINAFVLALTGGESAYDDAYPRCRWFNADVNDDRSVDFGDINAFVTLLTN